MKLPCFKTAKRAPGSKHSLIQGVSVDLSRSTADGV